MAQKRPDRITITDVARRAGVSTATAGRVLGGYGYASQQIRDRVRETADAMGYRFALVSKRTKPSRRTGKRTVAPDAPTGAGKRRVAQAKQQ